MRQIENFPNYFLTECGKVWSENRRRFLKGGLDSDGYLQWVACHEGSRKTLKMHRQAALLYLPNPDNLPVINHKNGIKVDNRIDNLEWCTISHNTKEAHRLGLIDQYGEKNPSCKYPDKLTQKFLESYTGGSIANHCRTYDINYAIGYAYIKGLRRQRTFND